MVWWGMILPKFTGSREEQARAVAEALVGLFGEAREEAKPSGYVGGRQEAMEALRKYRVEGYAGSRNKLGGGVSRLSFYIRHGVLGIREVAESVRERFGKSFDSVKFWQELGWRQFWRPGSWSNPLKDGV